MHVCFDQGDDTVGTTAKKTGNGYTYSDYVNWPEEERWEIIAGDAYLMTPAPSIRHQEIGGYLFPIFAQFFKERGCRPFYVPTDVVFDEQNIVQPDLLIVCDKCKIPEKNIQGAPDLVVGSCLLRRL